MDTDAESDPFLEYPQGSNLGSAAAVRFNTLHSLYEQSPCVFYTVVLFRFLLLGLFFVPIFFGIGCWNAPCKKPLAVFLLVHGLNHILVPMTQMLLPTVQGRSGRTFLTCLFFVSNVFGLIWFVQGAVWVFSISETSCDPLLYNVSFYLVIIVLSLILLSCCIAPLLLCCMLWCLVSLLQHAPLRNNGLQPTDLAKLPSNSFRPGMYEDADCKCAVCLSKYESADKLTTLVCRHHFHTDCVKVWLRTSATCPICRVKVTADQFGA